MIFLLLTASILSVAANDGKTYPINPLLGAQGYPDCVQPGPFSPDNVEANQMSKVCSQNKGSTASAVRVACVGDSITAGVCSSGPTKAYPAQLQAILDAEVPGKYALTNLGESGATMQKGADSPYWLRPGYQALITNKWDVVVIMLGTNDAKDPGDNGPNNWHDNCGTLTNLDLTNCSFAQDYFAMIQVVRGLGTTPGAPPTIYLAAPPPLNQHGAIGGNQTVINSMYPVLIPLIARTANVSTVPISIYADMGGVSDWQQAFPPSCTLNSSWPPCAYWCDTQSCDQCHPNDNGYTHLARAMQVGMNLF